jgi:hypothetical protein
VDGWGTNVADISWQMKRSGKETDVHQAIRLLAQRGIVDLLAAPIGTRKICRKVVTQAVLAVSSSVST